MCHIGTAECMRTEYNDRYAKLLIGTAGGAPFAVR